MQIIPNNPPNNNKITLDNALALIQQKRKIVVQVYENKVSLLIPYPTRTHASHNYGFWNVAGGHGMNSCSVSREEVIRRNVEGDCNSGVEIYLFNSLAEFAKACLDNKWE